VAPPLPEPAQPATPTARTIIVIIANFIGTSAFPSGRQNATASPVPNHPISSQEEIGIE
jgi:hypothetical protein